MSSDKEKKEEFCFIWSIYQLDKENKETSDYSCFLGEISGCDGGPVMVDAIAIFR